MKIVLKFLFKWLLISFFLFGCSANPFGNSHRIDAEGFMGITKSLEEVIATYPKLSEDTQVYCRSVDPLMEAPLGALNPAIPVKVGDPVVELWIRNQAGLLIPDFAVAGMPIPTGVSSLVSGVDTNVLNYHGDLDGNTALLTMLRLDTLVYEQYLFGTLYANAGGTAFERNVLCSVQPAVLDGISADSASNSSASVATQNTASNDSLINSFSADDLVNSADAFTPDYLLRKWTSACLDLGGQSFRYEIEFTSKESVWIRAVHWAVHSSSEAAKRCSLPPDVEQVIEVSKMKTRMDTSSSLVGEGVLVRNQLRFLSTVYLSFVNLAISNSNPALEKSVWYEGSSFSELGPMQFGARPNTSVGVRFISVSPEKMEVLFTLPEPATDTWDSQALIELK